MNKQKISYDGIPIIIYGERSNKAFIHVHGKFGQKEEATILANIVVPKGYQVISFDLPEHGERKDVPYQCSIQNAVHDLRKVYMNFKDKYESFSLYACSMGAYFSLTAYSDVTFEKCLLLSPLLNMKRLIENMMSSLSISEERLKIEKIIDTPYGEKLSWEYYTYVIDNQITEWNSSTSILYGEKDNITEQSVLFDFSNRFNCKIEIMKEGEHYFHTPEQIKYLNDWLARQEY
jgi:esterase/lipase